MTVESETIATVSRRTLANRRNAMRSTGPRSAAGRERSKFNALKHGLRAKTLVLPGEDPAEYERRLGDWMETLRPSDPVQEYMVRRAVHFSWLSDRLDRTEVAFLVAVTAEPVAEQERRITRLGADLFEVSSAMATLYPDWSEGLDRTGGSARTPEGGWKTIAQTSRELEATSAGCTWMLARWAELLRRLEQGQSWRSTDRLRAVRLLGKRPTDAADDDRVTLIYLACHAMDPTGPEAFAEPMAEPYGGEKTKLRKKLQRRNLAALEPPDPASGRAALLGIVAEAVARLEALRQERAESEPPAAAILAARLGPFDRETLERLRLHQARFTQALLRTLEALRKLRKEFGEADADDPDGDGEPVPADDAGRPPSPDPEPIAFQPADGPDAPVVTNEANAAEDVPDPVVRPAEPTAATNEANGSSASGRGLLGAVLAMLALLILAGLSAAFAGVVREPTGAPVPIPRRQEVRPERSQRPCGAIGIGRGTPVVCRAGQGIVRPPTAGH
jgi:hypothetical protein